ncbi:MAG: hypothetical protein ABSD45_24855, partial [Terriglobia bacterium]
MSLKVLPSRNRFDRLTSGHGRILLTLLLLFSLILAGLLRLAASRSKDSNQLLTEADRLAWLSNWQRAGELYARAEELAILKGDKRDQLYAACGRLRSSIGLESVPQTSAELTQILQDPIAASDSRLRIRCLATKGEIEREDHPDSAYRAWQEVLNLAQGLDDKSWEARARAELAIIEF